MSLFIEDLRVSTLEFLGRGKDDNHLIKKNFNDMVSEYRKKPKRFSRIVVDNKIRQILGDLGEREAGKYSDRIEELDEIRPPTVFMNIVDEDIGQKREEIRARKAPVEGGTIRNRRGAKLRKVA